MKKINYLLGLTLTLGLFLGSCKKEEEPSLGDPPTAADAAFTYEATSNPNVIEFTAGNKNLVAKWDFGNGTSAEGSVVTGSYPLKGTYTVTLTVFNSGGSKSSSQDIVIAEDDFSQLNDPLYNILTGGTSGPGSKTWVIDSTRDGHMGVHPLESANIGEWWTANRLDKSGTGLYTDAYVFHLNAFKFDHKTNGTVYVHNSQASNFPDGVENKTDFDVPMQDMMGETWTLKKNETDTTLEISGSAFIGLYTGVRTYKVHTISENELVLTYGDEKDAARGWYIRLRPSDYPVDNGGGGGTTGYSLPIDFEDATNDPEFEVFGGTGLSIIDNSVSGGANTSSRILEVVHGNETWAGFYVNLDKKLDFSGADSMISVMIYAPNTGRMRVKLENSAKTSEFIEKDVDVTKAGEWIEVKIGFSDAAVDTFDRLVLFPGWKDEGETAETGTYYIDNISQK